MCERRVDLIVCGLPLHRHSYIGFILDFASSIHNKQQFQWTAEVALGVSFNTQSQTADIPGASSRALLLRHTTSLQTQSKTPDVRERVVGLVAKESGKTWPVNVAFQV